MTEQPIFKIRKNPKCYPINFEKLKGESMETLPYILGILGFSEDYEYFDKIKHLLKIPEPPKSLEEIQQEFENKIDDLLEKTKRKFALSKENAEYYYKLKFNKIDKNFEYLKQWGHLPYFTLVPNGEIFINSGDYSGITIANNVTWGTEFNLNPSKNSVGYYYVEPDVKFNMSKKPNVIVRFFMNKLLGFKWKSTK